MQTTKKRRRTPGRTVSPRTFTWSSHPAQSSILGKRIFIRRRKGRNRWSRGSSQRRPVYSWAVLALTPGCRSGISAACAEELAMLKASGTCMGRTTPVELRPSVNLTAVLLPKSRNLTAAIWTRSIVWRMVHPSLSNGRGRRTAPRALRCLVCVVSTGYMRTVAFGRQASFWLKGNSTDWRKPSGLRKKQ